MYSHQKVSVIIPAFNEEDNIAKTLLALKKENNLEIILVNNGSTDRTSEIASSYGIKVIESPGGTIASVRNRGVQDSNAEILIFIDADVVVSKSWHKLLPYVVNELRQSPMTVTGSRVKTNNKNNWINNYWYSELTSYDAPYINSGHLITTKELFDKVNGFTASLETAEDYDFCQKAVKAGAKLINNPDLAVVHEGYPVSLEGFIKRERWHGSQDVDSWGSFIESKIAWIAAINLGLFLLSITLVLSGFYFVSIYYLTVMYAISFLLTIYKFGWKPIDYMLVMPVLFYFYLCGRSLAIIDKLFGFRTK